MVDDVSSEESRSTAENSPPTLSNQIGWVIFDETDNEDTICNNCIPEKKISEGNERYISRLEKELQRLQEKKRKPLSSKDMVKTLQEAKDSHMKQLMECTEQSEAFLTDDCEINQMSCWFPLYRAIFPKQPLTNEEHECLVQEEKDKSAEDQ